MRLRGFMVLASIILTFSAVAQDGRRKPNVSKEPLTDEQIAIYRAVLRNYMKESYGALNVSNRTEPLQLSRRFVDKDCIKGIALEIVANSVPVVHKLSRAVAINARITLVDAEQQRRKIKEGDFATGLFTLSEIAFDKPHRYALAYYSFVCGGLCGQGSMLVLQKVGDKWKLSKTCGAWIS
jgi:hypothetical protein